MSLVTDNKTVDMTNPIAAKCHRPTAKKTISGGAIDGQGGGRQRQNAYSSVGENQKDFIDDLYSLMACQNRMNETDS